MNRETALMRLCLSYRSSSRTRKEKETMWYSSHGCDSALWRPQDTVLYKMGELGDISRETLNGEKLVLGVFSMSVWGRRCERVEGKGKEEFVFFFIPLVAISVLLSRLPVFHLVSTCVLYPGHKSISQAILCGQWFGEHFLLRKAFGHWVTSCFCESFFFFFLVTGAIIIILIEILSNFSFNFFLFREIHNANIGAKPSKLFVTHWNFNYSCISHAWCFFFFFLDSYILWVTILDRWMILFVLWSL